MQKEIYTGRPLQTRITKYKSPTGLGYHMLEKYLHGLLGERSRIPGNFVPG
jgi:hypothetical protein